MRIILKKNQSFIHSHTNVAASVRDTGPMVWYQKFEYAVSHWLQKSTEHVLGCVLCSPGCFSLFRGSALMDDNVMKRYTTPPTEARHYVQYDQGQCVCVCVWGGGCQCVCVCPDGRQRHEALHHAAHRGQTLRAVRPGSVCVCVCVGGGVSVCVCVP